MKPCLTVLFTMSVQFITLVMSSLAVPVKTSGDETFALLLAGEESVTLGGLIGSGTLTVTDLNSVALQFPDWFDAYTR
ncbi:Uncharacterised protein [uncultured archaeon]|nr:Uncharacterised protein [uncultured archaeon]